MLSKRETVLWRRLESLEAKVQALEEYVLRKLQELSDRVDVVKRLAARPPMKPHGSSSSSSKYEVR